MAFRAVLEASARNEAVRFGPDLNFGAFPTAFEGTADPKIALIIRSDAVGVGKTGNS